MSRHIHYTWAKRALFCYQWFAGNAFRQRSTKAAVDFFFLSSCFHFFSTWVELIGGGLFASRSLVQLLVSAVRGFSSRVLDCGVFGLPGPLPAWAVVHKDEEECGCHDWCLVTGVQRGLQCIWERGDVGRNPPNSPDFVLVHSIQYSLHLLCNCPNRPDDECQWTKRCYQSSSQLNLSLNSLPVTLL